MTQSASFRPFDSLLDHDRALRILRDATGGAEDGEIFLERRRSEMLLFDDGRVKTASYDASEGFGLRAVRGEVAGYAHSTDISESALLRASETARLAVAEGGGTLACAPPATNRRLYTDADPLAGAGFPPENLDTRAVTTFTKGDDGFRIRTMELTVDAVVPGIDADTFAQKADDARNGCPVSNALAGNVEITLNASLI